MDPRGMIAFEVYSLGKAHLPSSVFLGVYAADTLPSTLPHSRACGFVANTDPAAQKGRHWVAFYFDRNGNGHYFDSFGQPPPREDWKDYLLHKARTRQWFWSPRPLQSASSPNCGPFAIYYLCVRHTTPLSITDTRLMKDVTEQKVFQTLHIP